MKNTLVLILLVCLQFLSLFAAAQQGLRFEPPRPFESIQAQAKEEHKLIFVSLYATWCTTCERMKKQVFAQPEVASFFEPRFISLRLDGEKDAVGKALLAASDFRAFPTYLFLDADGNLLHSAVGYKDAAALQALAQDALQPETQLNRQATRFAEGERDSAFLLRYAYLSHRYQRSDAEAVLEAFLKGQSDWNAEACQRAIFDLSNDPEGPAFQFMIRHQDAFAARFGEEALVERLLGAALLQLEVFMLEKDEQFSIERDVPAIFSRYLTGNRAERWAAHQQLRLYANDGQWPPFFDLARRYERRYLWFRRKGSDAAWRAANYLELATMVSENSDKRKHLKQASRWCRRSVKLNPSYTNCYTLALYYYNLEELRKSRKYLRKALKRSKKLDEEDRALLWELDRLLKDKKD